MELECDLSTIKNEELLRKMWQQSEDVNRKKEIRSHLYKLRELRLRDLYQGDIMSGNSAPGFGKDPLTPCHGDSLVDQSFQSLKSKEIRDSMSPPHDMKFHSLSLNHPNTSTGWDVQTSSEVSPDGRAFRNETVATTDGVEKINGGLAEFKGRNEQRSSASHQGDDKNFVKKASESSNTNLQEKVVIGDENSGRTEMKMSSKTSSSSSQVVSSSTVEYDGEPARDNRYLMDNESRHQQQQQQQQQQQYQQRLQNEEYRQQQQHEQNRQRLADQTTTQQKQRQEQQFTEQYNRNKEETSSSTNVETQRTYEENKRYVDMDKASPEYQQHVQYLMAQPGEVISSSVEYPKPNVKMITTVKRLPDGTIVKNKRYETEELRPSSESTRQRTTSSTNQQTNTQNTNTDRRTEDTTQDNIYSRLQKSRPHADTVDNAVPQDRHVVESHPPGRYTDDVANIEKSFSSVKKSSRRFSTETTSETIEEYDDNASSPNARGKPISGGRAPEDFSTHGFPSVRANKPTQEYPTGRPAAGRPSNDFSTQGFPSVRSNKPTQEYPSDRPQAVRFVPDASKPSSDLMPHGFHPTTTTTADGNVITVSSEKTRTSKHKTNTERIIETELVSDADYSSPRPGQISYTTTPGRPDDFSTHGFPSVKESSPMRDGGSPRQGTPSRDYPSSPRRGQPTEDFSTHGFPSARDTTKPMREGTPSRDYPSGPQRSQPTDDYSTHGFPSARDTTSPRQGTPTREYPTGPHRSQPTDDFSTHGFPSARDTTSRHTPTQSSPQPKLQPTSPTTRSTITTDTTKKLLQKEKETDASHRAFAASLRSSSPIDSPEYHRQTPRSSVSSTKTYKRDMREGSHDSAAPSETSRISSGTVTRTSPSKSVGKTVVTKQTTVKTRNGSNETIDLTPQRSTKSPSPGKTVTTTTTTKTTTTKNTPTDVPKSDNQITQPAANQFPINEPLTITKTHFSSNDASFPRNQVVEKPCLKKQYYQLGPSDNPTPISDGPAKAKQSAHSPMLKHKQYNDNETTTTTTKPQNTDTIRTTSTDSPVKSDEVPPTTTESSKTRKPTLATTKVPNEQKLVKHVTYTNNEEQPKLHEKSPFSPAPSSHTNRTHPKNKSPTRDDNPENYEEFINEPSSRPFVVEPNDRSHPTNNSKNIRHPKEPSVERSRAVVRESTFEKTDKVKTVVNEGEYTHKSPARQDKPKHFKEPSRPSEVEPNDRSQSPVKPRIISRDNIHISNEQCIDLLQFESEIIPEVKRKTPDDIDYRTDDVPTNKKPIQKTPKYHEDVPKGTEPTSKKPIHQTHKGSEPSNKKPIRQSPEEDNEYPKRGEPSDQKPIRTTPSQRENYPKGVEPTNKKPIQQISDDHSKGMKPIRQTPEDDKEHPKRGDSPTQKLIRTTPIDGPTYKKPIHGTPDDHNVPKSHEPHQKPKPTKSTPQRLAQYPINDDDDHPVTKPTTYNETTRVEELFMQTHPTKKQPTKNVNDEFIFIERSHQPHPQDDESPDGGFISKDCEPVPTSPTYKKKGLSRRETFEERCRQILGMEEDGDTQGTFIKKLPEETDDEPNQNVPLESDDEPTREEPSKATKTPFEPRQREPLESEDEPTQKEPLKTTKDTMFEVRIEDCDDDEPLYLSNVKESLETRKEVTIQKTNTTKPHKPRTLPNSDTEEFIETEYITKTSPVKERPTEPENENITDEDMPEVDVLFSTERNTLKKKHITKTIDEKNTTVGRRSYEEPHGRHPTDKPDFEGEPIVTKKPSSPTKPNGTVHINEKTTVVIETRRSKSPEHSPSKIPSQVVPESPSTSDTESPDVESEVDTEQENFISEKVITCNEDTIIKEVRKSPSPERRPTTRGPNQKPVESHATPTRASPYKSPSKKPTELITSPTRRPNAPKQKPMEPSYQPSPAKPKATDKSTMPIKPTSKSPIKSVPKIVDDTTTEKRRTSKTSTTSTIKTTAKHTIPNKEDAPVNKRPISQTPKTITKEIPARIVRKDSEISHKTTQELITKRQSRKPSPRAESPTSTIKDRLRSSPRKQKPDDVDANSSPDTSPTRFTERRRSSNISVHTEIIIDHAGPKSPKQNEPAPRKQPQPQKPHTTGRVIDATFLDKSPRKLPVTERKESAPVHRVTRRDKDVKMSRSTSENVIKVTGKPVKKPEMSSLSPSLPSKSDRRPNKCFTTKTINLTTTDKIISSEDMENIIIDIQHAKSSREPSPDKIVPTPVPIDLDTGLPRYPDVVQEPEDEPRKKPLVKNIPIFEEESNDFVGCHISEINIEKSTKATDYTDYYDEILVNPTIEAPKSLEYPSIDKPDDDCLLSVHEKVTKFAHTAEEVKKPKASSPFNREFDQTPKVPENDDCLLTVDQKVSKFLKTAESITKSSTPVREIERPNYDDIDEDLRQDECTLTVSQKVNKFIDTAEKLAPTAPQKSPELVARMERHISRQSEPEYPDLDSEDEPLPFSENHTIEIEMKRQKDILSRPSVWKSNETEVEEGTYKTEPRQFRPTTEDVDDDELVPMTKTHTTSIEMKRQKDILSRPTVFDQRKAPQSPSQHKPQSPIAKRLNTPEKPQRDVTTKHGYPEKPYTEDEPKTTVEPKSHQRMPTESPKLNDRNLNTKYHTSTVSATKSRFETSKDENIVTQRKPSTDTERPKKTQPAYVQPQKPHDLPNPKRKPSSERVETVETEIEIEDIEYRTTDTEKEVITSRRSSSKPKDVETPLPQNGRPTYRNPSPGKFTKPKEDYAPVNTKYQATSVSTTRSRFETSKDDKTAPRRKPSAEPEKPKKTQPRFDQPKRKPSTDREETHETEIEIQDIEYRTTDTESEVTTRRRSSSKPKEHLPSDDEKVSPQNRRTPNKINAPGKLTKPIDEFTPKEPTNNRKVNTNYRTSVVSTTKSRFESTKDDTPTPRRKPSTERESPKKTYPTYGKQPRPQDHPIRKPSTERVETRDIEVEIEEYQTSDTEREVTYCHRSSTKPNDYLPNDGDMDSPQNGRPTNRNISPGRFNKPRDTPQEPMNNRKVNTNYRTSVVSTTKSRFESTKDDTPIPRRKPATEKENPKKTSPTYGKQPKPQDQPIRKPSTEHVETHDIEVEIEDIEYQTSDTEREVTYCHRSSSKPNEYLPSDGDMDSPRKGRPTSRDTPHGKLTKPENISHSPISSPNTSTKTTVTKITERTLKHTPESKTPDTEFVESILEQPKQVRTSPGLAGRPKVITETVAARRNIFERGLSNKSDRPTTPNQTGRRPSYMDHTKSSLEHTRRDSLEINKSHYSRRSSIEDETQYDRRPNVAVKFDVPQRARKEPSVSEDINVEEIFELEILEHLLETVTSYEIRRRIRAQIRLVKKNQQNTQSVDKKKVETKQSTNISSTHKSSTYSSKMHHEETDTYSDEKYSNKPRDHSPNHPSKTHHEETLIITEGGRTKKPRDRSHSPEAKTISSSLKEVRRISGPQTETSKHYTRTEQVDYSTEEMHSPHSPHSPNSPRSERKRPTEIHYSPDATGRPIPRERTDSPEYKSTPRQPSERRESPEHPRRPLASHRSTSPESKTKQPYNPDNKNRTAPQSRSRSPQSKSRSPHDYAVSKTTTTTTTRTTHSPERKTSARTRPEEKTPIWSDRKNVLKKNQGGTTTTITTKTISSPTTRTTTTKQSSTSQQHRKKNIEEDCITSSYGIGPTDENGLPLFGIKALKKKKPTQPCEATEEVTGYVVEEKYYSDNRSKPQVERKEFIYSTNAEELEEIKNKVESRKSSNDDGVVRRFQKIDKDYIHNEPQAILPGSDDYSTSSSTKIVRRGSVKEMSEKFIRKESSQSITEKSNGSYPKAGLILLTSPRLSATDAADCFELNSENYQTKSTRDVSHYRSTDEEETQDGDCEIEMQRSSRMINESYPQSTESDCESMNILREVSKKSSTSTRSFLNSSGESKVVTGVDDVLERMRNADNVVVEGDTAEDQEARSLLNKFLGASVIMRGVETVLPTKQTKITTSYANSGDADNLRKQEVKTTRVTKTIKSGSSSSPVTRTTCDIEEIWDEEILKELLEQAKTYEERRKIRARLREVMAEREEKKSLKAGEKAAPATASPEVEDDDSSASEYEEIIEEVTDDSAEESEEEEKTAEEAVIPTKKEIETKKDLPKEKLPKEGVEKSSSAKSNESTKAEKTTNSYESGVPPIVEESTEKGKETKEVEEKSKPNEEVSASGAQVKTETDQSDSSEKKEQQHSSSTTEKTETKEKDGAVVTTTTKVTTRTVSGGIAPKPVSPFAKFRQLDKQNSQQSPKSPSTPTTPGGTTASPSASVSAPIFKFTDPSLNARAATVKDQLLQWCQIKTKEYENVQVTNFSTSWNDGLAFCALIHHFLPDAFDYSKLTQKSRRHNFTLAFTVADEKAGIAPLLDVEDMVVMQRPDWKCVFVYVQSIYRRFRNCQ